MEEQAKSHAPSDLPPAQVSRLVDLLEREGLGADVPGSLAALEQALDRRRIAEQELLDARQELDQLRARLSDLQREKLELQQKHAALFHHNIDAIFSVDTQGRFTNANSVCVEITGYPLSELLELSFYQLCAPDQLEQTVANFSQCLQGNFQRLET